MKWFRKVCDAIVAARMRLVASMILNQYGHMFSDAEKKQIVDRFFR
jgi:hypothetical protein